MQYLCFCGWLISLKIHASCSVCQTLSPILKLNNSPFYVYTAFCLSTDEQQCCFYFLAIVNNGTVNMSVRQLFQTLLLILLHIITGVGLLDHMAVLCKIFLRNQILFSIADVSLYSPTNSAQAFQFLYLFTHTCFLFCQQSF